MNYTEILESSIVPEWKTQYIHYKELQRIIQKIENINQNNQLADNQQEVLNKIIYYDEVYQVVSSIDSNSAINEDANDHIQKINKQFWNEMKFEIDRINKFFMIQLNKLTQLILEIETQCDMLEHIKSKEQQTIRDNMHEVYKSLSILGIYAQRNYLGFQTLAKSRDKILGATDSNALLLDIVQGKRFALDDPIEYEQQRVEKAFAKLFKVDQKTAKVQIEQYVSPQNNAEKQRVQAATGNGFTFGISILLFINFLYVIGFEIFEYGNNVIVERHEVALKAMRILFCLTYLGIGLGLDIYVFEKKKLNYIFIYELPPAQITASYRTHLKYCFIFLSILSFCCTCAVLRFYLDEHLVSELPTVSYSLLFVSVSSLMPAWAWISLPLLYPLFYLVVIVFQWRSSQVTVGKYILQVIGKQVVPWRYRVSFPIFCFCDQLTSITQLFADFADLICGGKSPTVVSCFFVNIPSIIRIAQQFVRYNEHKLFYPHMVNVAKYLSSFAGTFVVFEWVKNSPVWMTVMVAGHCVETAFKVYWDNAEDWAFFTGGSGARKFSAQPHKWQNKLICRRPSFFPTHTQVIAIIFNFIGRVFWIPCTYLKTFSSQQFWWKTYAAVLEITRRCLWNVLRTDNQQVTNCEEYSLTRYIPVLLSQNERQILRQKMEEKELELKQERKAAQQRNKQLKIQAGRREDSHNERRPLLNHSSDQM
ncbi:EXS_family protein [Hexamita inflata]|uniref:EXS family protein n=1 Tax=Hexamita inflata TaxID=28002 RepID=A0AA86TYK4_9EUKA|nr:EXS family protein [Hexamita inflata]CAI9969356.1 EXS family protein [Hexamita inflata]